jgi:hypothetical protein
MDQIKTSESTPDQLLKLLDAQLAHARSTRSQPRAGRRTAILVVGLLLILGGCFAALVVLQQMLVELPRPAAGEARTEVSPATP